MTAPTPAQKANTLILEINEMLNTGVDFERLNEIEFEARRIQDYDYGSAKRLLGVIAGMRRDKDEINSQFNAAIRSGGRHPAVLLNFATALASVGEVLRAIEIIDEVVEQSEGDAFVLDRAINIHLEGFDVDGAENLIPKIIRLGIDYDFEVVLESIKNIRDIFAKTGADWNVAASRIKVAFDALLPETRNIRRIDLCFHEGTILNNFVIDDDVEKIMRAESMMNDAIASQPYDPVDSAIYFACCTQ